MAAASFLSIPQILLGYYKVPGALVLLTPYIHTWHIIIVENQFVSGPSLIILRNFSVATIYPIVTLFVCPTLNLFDRRAQKNWCKFILVLNIVITAVYICLFFPENGVKFVLAAEEIKSTIIMNTIVLAVYSCFMIYHNDLVNQVYEEVKQGNESMAANTREKEEFFATISHEIRNPLQSLQGSVELMRVLRDRD